MSSHEEAYGDEMRAFAEELIRFDTTDGNERPAQEFVRDRLEELGFETYTWFADAEELAAHPSFPPAEELEVDDRPSVAGVLELGDPDAGKTIVLNGHVDVVPAAGNWTGEPFEPRWEGDWLVARGATDMKSQLSASVFAARHLADRSDADGRIVVESVAGEEEGGFGAAAAARTNPYPFERDAAIVAESTDMRLVIATEGCLMMRLGVEGQAAHAARRWRGEDVLPHFDRIREAFEELEAARAERVNHPLYGRFETPWPVVIGRVRAGTWASNVAGHLSAEMRIGVAPGETLDAVEREFRARLEEVADENEWLAEHPPAFERFGIQFESAEIDVGEPIVRSMRDAMEPRGLDSAPTGESYGTDARYYIAAGIPAVVFGPGTVDEAHFADESIHWPEVIEAADVIVDATQRFLRS